MQKSAMITIRGGDTYRIVVNKNDDRYENYIIGRGRNSDEILTYSKTKNDVFDSVSYDDQALPWNITTIDINDIPFSKSAAEERLTNWDVHEFSVEPSDIFACAVNITSINRNKHKMAQALIVGRWLRDNNCIWFSEDRQFKYSIKVGQDLVQKMIVANEPNEYSLKNWSLFMLNNVTKQGQMIIVYEVTNSRLIIGGIGHSLSTTYINEKWPNK